MTKKEHISQCPYCGQSLRRNWHRITSGLVHALVKAYVLVCSSGTNHFTKSQLTLSHNEYGNFQKLRFHGLIAKYEEKGEKKRGEWLITRRGAQFLHGEIRIPLRVLTFNNTVEGHDEALVSLRDVIGSQPDFEQYESIEFEPVNSINSFPVTAFFNNKGQGMMFANEQQQMSQARM